MLPERFVLFCFCLLATTCLAPATAAGEEAWGVHLASYRSESKAQAGWIELQARHQELLAPLDCRFVPVDIPGKGPGKGRFLRIIAGTFADRGQARALEHALEAQGAYAETIPCQLDAPLARTSEPAPLSVTSRAQPVVAATAPPVAPAPPQVKAPQAPRVASPGLAATTNSKASQASGVQASGSQASGSQTSGKGLRKYVPPPVVESFKAVLQPLSPKEQEFRKKLPPLPENSRSSLSGKSFHVGFKDEDSLQDGLTLANSPDRNSRISAQYGNMEKDYETVKRISPLSAGDSGNNFKPYFGFGFHF